MLGLYALAISADTPGQVTPVIYDLKGDSTEIGAAEENHVVLQGLGVEPFHLALRSIKGRLYVLTEVQTALKQDGAFWQSPLEKGVLYCSEHGRISDVLSSGDCPLCNNNTSRPWLMCPVKVGEVIQIGKHFRAAVLSQRVINVPEDDPEFGRVAPWPDTSWLLNPPGQPGTIRVEPETDIKDESYPFDNSNFWVWNPPETPFPVFIHHKANLTMSQHAYAHLDREVGGLVLGHVYHDPDNNQIYPIITDAIMARFAVEQRGQLTFTQQTWLELHRKREEHYPDTEILGWYHTHPGLDIFLSRWDLFIHENFFSLPWQVAVVIDPHQSAGGIFVWKDGKILNPSFPYRPFRVADLNRQQEEVGRTRVRINLKERSP